MLLDPALLTRWLNPRTAKTAMSRMLLQHVVALNARIAELEAKCKPVVEMVR